jgi:flavin-dependent dehydrogenase
MPSARADIAIIGAGPAGSAAALTLRRHAPGLRLALIEAGDHSAARPGEVLPAVARGLLEQLGVMPAFEAAGFVAGRALASAWGQPDLDERHSIFSAQGSGWHLDRARFDRLLAEAAQAAGAGLRTGSAVRSAEPLGEEWRLHLADGATVDARALVWATGRRWRLARPLGARLTVHEDLAAHTRFYRCAPGDCRTVIEACGHGWWYSTDLPGGRRVVACLTDPATGEGLALRTAKGWGQALEGTRHIAALVADGVETGAGVHAAGTATLDPGAGRRWVAAGDTLFAADPLSSRGIVHALRSGVLAAYAAADTLDGREAEAQRRLEMIHARGFADYVAALAGHYAVAARRFDTPFWAARKTPSPLRAGGFA